MYPVAEDMQHVFLHTQGLTCYSLAPQNMENIKRMNLNNPLEGRSLC